ncbi:hypothetical protein B0T19DRAFT_479755 [Cercophora scortea]|uniref:Uncharacterized protein n=1 Tax=Cercophora scortea TaxID=314031 RepID=A0AAE0I3L2_9PEZI|nr:hypothetical protein B0T19DRAFT_479755 [Cercophora scortea]
MRSSSIIQILGAASMTRAAMAGSAWSWTSGQSLALRCAGAVVGVCAPVMAVPVVDLGHQGHRRANISDLLRHPNATFGTTYEEARAKNFTNATYAKPDEDASGKIPADVAGYVVANLTGIAVANSTGLSGAGKVTGDSFGRLSTQDFVKRQLEARSPKAEKRQQASGNKVHSVVKDNSTWLAVSIKDAAGTSKSGQGSAALP